MLPQPRSSCAGLTTRATLVLALAGAGAAVFLFVVFPRISSSRAAERGTHAVVTPAESADAPTTATTEVLVLDPSEIPAPAAPDEAKPAPTTAAAPAAQSSLVASNDALPAPELKHLKGGGKSDKIPPGAGRAEQRKERKEREREAAAMGETPPQRAAAKPAAAANPNRARLETTKGAKGRPGSREKKEKKEKPADG